MTSFFIGAGRCGSETYENTVRRFIFLNHLPFACPKILAPFKMSNAVAIVIFAIVIFPLSTAKQLILLQIEIGYLVQQTN